MSDDAVAGHYTHGQLLDAILAGIQAMGKTPETVTVDDLAPVDEFHIGGRQATEDFIGQLNFSPSDNVLDVGCGLAGTARYAASKFGCHIFGIDLTAEYIEVAKKLCAWVDLANRIDLHQGSALETGFEASFFDAAYMLHVGMNIEQKAELFAEVNRVLRPGATFGIYDIMQTGDSPLIYPVPWATTPGTSSLASPNDYKMALVGAGFEIIAERDRRKFASEFFNVLRERAKVAAGPPPLGLHVLMGEAAAAKYGNMVDNVAAGAISPVEIIARKLA